MIHCQKCKQANAPDAPKCSQCGTDLLPGTGAGVRLGGLGCFIIIAAIAFALAFFVLKNNIILLSLLVLFGVLELGYGIYWSLRKIPPYERYETRAKRHVELDPQQAISDYGSAIGLAPEAKAFDLCCERAKFLQSQGLTEEARSDWQRALDNINNRMAKSKTPVLAQMKQRAEIYKNLGLEDEYAMEMLKYTIEKEKTFKFKRSDVAMGVQDGIKKGSEDADRNVLQKLRQEIMVKSKYGIVGQCKQCNSIVELNYMLDCTNNLKHWKITNIAPIIRKDDISEGSRSIATS